MVHTPAHELLIDQWLSEEGATRKERDDSSQPSHDEETVRDNINYKEWSANEESLMLYKCNWKQLPLFSRLELSAQYIALHSNTSVENARTIVKQTGIPEKVTYLRKEARVSALDMTAYSGHDLYLEQNDTRCCSDSPCRRSASK